MSTAQATRDFPFWCHLCRRGVNANLQEATGEYQCFLCGNTFVEDVNHSNQSTSRLLSYTASDPSHAAPPQTANVGTSTTGGPTSNPFLTSVENALLRSLGGLEEQMNGSQGGTGQPSATQTWTTFVPSSMGAGGPAPVASPVDWLRPDLQRAPPSRTTQPAGSSSTRFSSGSVPGVPPSQQQQQQGGGIAQGPVRFYVNRDMGSPGSLWSILQPLLGGIEAGLMGGGGGTSLGDYAFGDMSTILQQLMMADPNRHGPPPASASAVQALETHRVSQEQVDLSWECPVCKDVFNVDEETRRMPCDHFFHPDCLLTWLKQHNNCPVCRLELPTDDPDYERYRAQRAPPTPAWPTLGPQSPP